MGRRHHYKRTPPPPVSHRRPSAPRRRWQRPPTRLKAQPGPVLYEVREPYERHESPHYDYPERRGPQPVQQIPRPRVVHKARSQPAPSQSAPSGRVNWRGKPLPPARYIVYPRRSGLTWLLLNAMGFALVAATQIDPLSWVTLYHSIILTWLMVRLWDTVEGSTVDELRNDFSGESRR